MKRTPGENYGDHEREGTTPQACAAAKDASLLHLQTCDEAEFADAGRADEHEAGPSETMRNFRDRYGPRALVSGAKS